MRDRMAVVLHGGEVNTESGGIIKISQSPYTAQVFKNLHPNPNPPKSSQSTPIEPKSWLHKLELKGCLA